MISNTGTATGWNVYKATTFSTLGPSSGWHWSAYGPNGGCHGTEKTKEAAVKIALAQAEWLNRPRSVEE